MADWKKVEANIEKLINDMNATTGNSDTNLTDGVNALIGGYGKLTTDTLVGLENGYDVMFYDENNEGLAFYSIKEGGSIDAPIYVCDGWQNADNQVVVFPYSPTEDIALYPLIESLEVKLYKFYGVEREDYPYLCLTYGSGFKQLSIMFGKNKNWINSAYQIQDGYFAYTDYANYPVTFSDLSDLGSVVAKCMEMISEAPYSSTAKLTLTNRNDYYHYVNFDVTLSNATVYRLDE